MALKIENPEVERLAAEVAALAGESQTEAIRRAPAARREQLARQVVVRGGAASYRRFPRGGGLAPRPCRPARAAALPPRAGGAPRRRAGARVILDRSAILAVIGREPGFEDLLARLDAACHRPLLCVGDDFAKTDLDLA